MIENLYYNKNFDLNEAIDFVFSSDNPVHQGLIISKLNEDMYNPQLIDEFRKYIKKKSTKIKPFYNSLDTCGTGGDGKKTLNISTTVALLLASIGIKISKHGNRAASSLSGSSDILNELGIKMEFRENKIIGNLKKNNFTYLNAPNFYPILKNVAETRKLLGFKTFFNIKSEFNIAINFEETTALLNGYLDILNDMLKERLKIDLRKYNIVSFSNSYSGEAVVLTKENTKKTAEGEVLDTLKLTSMCCRRHMLTHVDIE